MKHLLAAALLLAACGSSSHTVATGQAGYADNRGQVQSISCRRSVENCWDEATNVCPGGYDVMDSGTGTRIIPISGVGPIAVQKYSVLVRCRGAEVAVE
jgi:hypothetical protein